MLKRRIRGLTGEVAAGRRAGVNAVSRFKYPLNLLVAL